VSPSHRVLAHTGFWLGLLLVGVFSTGCRPKPQTKPAPPGVVKTAPVLQRNQPISQEWIGGLDGAVNAQIRAQVTGYVLRQEYVDGRLVHKGDRLFEIDPRTFQAAAGQVKAVYDKAELDLQRATTLARENAAAQQDRDNALHAFESAKAALQAAQLNLEFTHITSPIDGIAGVATAQIGDLVGPGSGVLTTVSSIDPIKAYFAIDEQTYLAFHQRRPDQPPAPEGLEYQLVLADGSTYPHKGRFFAIDREINENTGTLRLVAEFPNPDLLLRPGQYARVRAVVREEKHALLVPQRAVSELQGTYQVITVDAQHRAHVQNVRLGARIGNLWIVESGLKPGDQVIVEGVQKARDGALVSPESFAASGAPPAGPADGTTAEGR
jgi:membrane fusion protein (multidrug efflux system)